MTPTDRFLAEVARRNADAGPEVLASALREMRGHLEERAIEFQAGGMTPDAAEEKAVGGFGSPRLARVWTAWYRSWCFWVPILTWIPFLGAMAHNTMDGWHLPSWATGPLALLLAVLGIGFAHGFAGWKERRTWLATGVAGSIVALMGAGALAFGPYRVVLRDGEVAGIYSDEGIAESRAENSRTLALWQSVPTRIRSLEATSLAKAKAWQYHPSGSIFSGQFAVPVNRSDGRPVAQLTRSRSAIESVQGWIWYTRHMRKAVAEVESIEAGNQSALSLSPTQRMLGVVTASRMITALVAGSLACLAAGAGLAALVRKQNRQRRTRVSA